MQYTLYALITLALLGLVSAGWYWLFKRFERRMSERFDDLVTRTTALPDLFGHVMDYQHRYHKELDALLRNQDGEMEKLEELLLGVKHDLFLEYLKQRTHEAHEAGDISATEVDRYLAMLDSFKLDNYSRT